MTKLKNITYKVFLFERVKKKIKFFNTETYPLQIRLTAGTRTLYLKSYFFSIMQQNKYQQESLFTERKISIDDVICSEEELMKYLLSKETKTTSLDEIRQEYYFSSYDILHLLDENFKKFLVSFFYEENLPAYSLFIQNDGANHTSEFILGNLEMSLQQSVFNKLLKAAAEKAPPYIPFIKFFREKIKTPVPVFPVYQWKQENILNEFTSFIDTNFPEYKLYKPAEYINALLEKPGSENKKALRKFPQGKIKQA
ncbi:MAG TPA: hypothetical protein VKI61_00015 [Chitinophagaceae bacterium]|jgi:hypothetical protein|nr:hypothetical protein [Chitinophagaceae bacterium]